MRTRNTMLHRAGLTLASMLILASVACRPMLETLVAGSLEDRLGRLDRFGVDPGPPSYEPTSFTNWESPHVAPLALTPDRARLLAVNTPAARLDVLAADGDGLAVIAEIPVGLDPVTVRARSNAEAWVVNHVSDSISIVDLERQVVTMTLQTADEPTDVVFTDSAAFVVCSQANQVLVFDLGSPDAAPRVIDVAGEDPRAAAISPDGRFVYVAVFESGNLTTMIRQRDVSDEASPYGGQNPPPNTLDGFAPAVATEREAPPAGLIVRKDLATGAWLDESGADWSEYVTWDLLDHDVAVIDTDTLEVSYIPHLMNLNMQLAVMPDGRLSVVGTEATNEIRFEPNLTSKFVRHHLAIVDPADPSSAMIRDLNPHLLPLYDSGITTLPAADRAPSLADPRAVVWAAESELGYVAGLGSNNVAIIDADGARMAHIPVEEGPTGLALDEPGQRLFVLNRFASSISVIDTGTQEVTERVALFDPTPAAIKDGRKFLYDAHLTSGLGTTPCAACHIDGRMDQLAWDLGNPHDPVKPFDQICDDLTEGAGGQQVDCSDFHPLKGPMTTQTLQGIVGIEPLHWRGDRQSLADFNIAFTGLNGNDRQLTDAEMAAFEAFIASLRFAPNPFRAVDNTLPTDLRGGNAQRGREFYVNTPVDAIHGRIDLLAPAFQDVVAAAGPVLSCNRCHALPTGTNQLITTATDLDEPQDMKVPQLRNAYEKHGFDRFASDNIGAGFGFTHDGAFGTLDDFFALQVFDFTDDGSDGLQHVADVIAFVLAMSTDTHASVGRQITIAGDAAISDADADVVATMIALADGGDVGLIVTGLLGGESVGFAYLGDGQFAGRLVDSEMGVEALLAPEPGDYLTWTLVPVGAERRLSIDADANGAVDGSE